MLNGTISAFKTILAQGLTKVYVIGHDDWDEHIPTVLWAYNNTPKKWLSTPHSTWSMGGKQ